MAQSQSRKNPSVCYVLQGGQRIGLFIATSDGLIMGAGHEIHGTLLNTSWEEIARRNEKSVISAVIRGVFHISNFFKGESENFLTLLRLKTRPSIKKHLDKLGELMLRPMSGRSVQETVSTFETCIVDLLAMTSEEIMNLREENARLVAKIERLQRPRAMVEIYAGEALGKKAFQLTSTLFDIKKQHQIKDFSTSRGSNATDPSVWIVEKFGGHLSTEDLNIVLSNKAIWFQVDRGLYKTINEREYRARKAASLPAVLTTTPAKSTRPSNRSSVNFTGTTAQI